MKPFIEAIEFKGIEALRLNGPRGSSATVARLGGQVLAWDSGLFSAVRREGRLAEARIRTDARVDSCRATLR